MSTEEVRCKHGMSGDEDAHRPRDGHTCEICRSQPLFARGAQNVASNDSEVVS